MIVLNDVVIHFKTREPDLQVKKGTKLFFSYYCKGLSSMQDIALLAQNEHFESIIKIEMALYAYEPIIGKEKV